MSLLEDISEETTFSFCDFKITRKCIDKNYVHDKEDMVCENMCKYCRRALNKMVQNKNRKMLRLCVYNIAEDCCIINNAKYFKPNTKMCKKCYQQYYKRWKIEKYELKHKKTEDDVIKPQPVAHIL